MKIAKPNNRRTRMAARRRALRLVLWVSGLMQRTTDGPSALHAIRKAGSRGML